MAEAAAVAETPATPAPPVAPAEVVAPDSPKTPAESAPAPAPENAKPDNSATDEKRGSRRFERRISQAIRRAAEARAEADILRKQIEELKKPQAPQDPGAPRIEQFDDVEKYAEAREKYAREQERKSVEAERQTKARQAEMTNLQASWEKKADRGEDKYEDWDEVVGEMKPDSVMAVAIMDEDNAEDIAYHLGKNLEEAKRIAALPPRSQIREIAKLGVKLTAEPPMKPKAPSKAPAPINPVAGTKAAEVAEVKDGMSYKDFVKVRNRQLGRST